MAIKKLPEDKRPYAIKPQTNLLLAQGEGAIDARRPLGTIVHRPPTLPIMIDHQQAQREEIRDFLGTPLHTVVDRDAVDGKMLRIFTDRHKAEQYVRELAANASSGWIPMVKKRSGNIEPDPPQPGQGYVDLYEDVDWGGCDWRVLESGHWAVDFTKLWACGFLWWGWKNANDTVSCLDIDTGASTVILCSEVNLGGNWIWFPGVAWIPNLVPFGWNDMASSMLWMYFA